MVLSLLLGVSAISGAAPAPSQTRRAGLPHAPVRALPAVPRPIGLQPGLNGPFLPAGPSAAPVPGVPGGAASGPGGSAAPVPGAPAAIGRAPQFARSTYEPQEPVPNISNQNGMSAPYSNPNGGMGGSPNGGGSGIGAGYPGGGLPYSGQGSPYGSDIYQTPQPYTGPNPGRFSDRPMIDYKNLYKDSTSEGDLPGHNCTARDGDAFTCMVCNIVFEACDQPSFGKEQVARSVLERMHSSAYPATVCQNVYKGWDRPNGLGAQYSWTNDGKNHHLPSSSRNSCLSDSIKAAKEAFKKGPNGYTNYFAPRFADPNWAYGGTCKNTLVKVYSHNFCAINARRDRSDNQIELAEQKLSGKTLSQQVAKTDDGEGLGEAGQ